MQKTKSCNDSPNKYEALKRYLKDLLRKSRLEEYVSREEIIKTGYQILRELNATRHLELKNKGDWRDVFKLLRKARRNDD